MRYLAVDLGGTTTRFGIFDENLLLEHKYSFSTNRESPKEFLEQIHSFTMQFSDIISIGISSPGPLNVGEGLILNPPNLPGWHNLKILNEITSLTGIPSILEGDARCAGYAETSYSTTEDNETVVFLTISTGIGCSIIENGKIRAGVHGFAGEIANSILWRDGPQQGFLQKGSIESISSGTAILKRATENGLNVSSTKEVFELYAENQIANRIIDDAIEYLSNFIAIVQSVIDPSKFILGGSVILRNDWILHEISARVKSKVYEDLSYKTNIHVATLGDDAGLHGAAMLAKKSNILGRNSLD